MRHPKLPCFWRTLCPRRTVPMDEQVVFHVRDLLPQIEDMLAKPSRITIKAQGRILLVDPADVVTVQAAFVASLAPAGSEKYFRNALVLGYMYSPVCRHGPSFGRASRTRRPIVRRPVASEKGLRDRA